MMVGLSEQHGSLEKGVCGAEQVELGRIRIASLHLAIQDGAMPANVLDSGSV